MCDRVQRSTAYQTASHDTGQTDRAPTTWMGAAGRVAKATHVHTVHDAGWRAEADQVATTQCTHFFICK